MNLKFLEEDIRKPISEKIDANHPIYKALRNGKLVLFIGAGMSMHLGMPGWRDFALKYLDLVYKYKNTFSFNHKAMESLKKEETKKILSVCKYIASENLSKEYEEKELKNWFTTNIEEIKKKGWYEKLYSLNAVFVTTNYDNALDLLVRQNSGDAIFSETTGEKSSQLEYLKSYGEIFYKVESFNKDILKVKNVIHIHGSIEDTKGMIISNEDYIKRYSRYNSNANSIYAQFMDGLFNGDYVMLFIGYGLEELEILQYLFNDGKNIEGSLQNRYVILPCYSDDCIKISYLSQYYEKYYKIQTIPIDMTKDGYDSYADVIETLTILNEISLDNDIFKKNDMKKYFMSIKEL